MNKKEQDKKTELNKEEVIDESSETKESDNRKISEKVEDFLDDVDNEIFGDEPFDTAIPATIKKDSGGRKVVKWKTNANIQKKLFGGKKGAMVLFIILGIGGLCALFVYLVGLILKI